MTNASGALRSRVRFTKDERERKGESGALVSPLALHADRAVAGLNQLVHQRQSEASALHAGSAADTAELLEKA